MARFKSKYAGLPIDGAVQSKNAGLLIDGAPRRPSSSIPIRGVAPLLPPASMAESSNSAPQVIDAAVVAAAAEAAAAEAAAATSTTENPPQPPEIVSETIGFLLSQFNLQWSTNAIERIRRVADVNPGAWVYMRTWIELGMEELEKTMPRRAQDFSVASAVFTDDECESSEDEDTAVPDEEGFSVGAAPVVPKWNDTYGKYGFWLVQRVGHTATLTNEVTERMDPRHYRRQLGKPPKPCRKVDEAFLSEVLRPELVFDCHRLVAIHLQITNGNVRDCFVLLSEWCKVRPHGVCSLKFVSASDFVHPPSASSAATTTSERKVDCSALENVVLEADELTDEFMQAVDCRLKVRPSNSLQLCTKSWKVAADASSMGIFANNPRQVTISTAFIKKVAQFLATIPTCQELILPQFGMRATAPVYFVDLVREKKGQDARFGKIVLGDCKMTQGAVTPSPDALAALKSVSRSMVLEHGNRPPTVELTTMEAGVFYTTALTSESSCSCGGDFELWPECTAAASTCSDGGVEELYMQSRCVQCDCVVFVKVDVTQQQSNDAPPPLLATTVATAPPPLLATTTVAPASRGRGGKRKRKRPDTAAAVPPQLRMDPYACDRRIKTLYLEGVPEKDGALCNRLSCFTEVENVYVGDTSSTASGPLAGRPVARFLGRFKKIKNVVVLLPRKSDKVKFTDDVKVACPMLQRLCLTKRHEGTDVVAPAVPAVSRFAYNVVPPPSKKDVIISKVRWSPIAGGGVGSNNGEDVVNADIAAAVARCTADCSNFIPHATSGLYVFKKNA